MDGFLNTQSLTKKNLQIKNSFLCSISQPTPVFSVISCHGSLMRRYKNFYITEKITWYLIPHSPQLSVDDFELGIKLGEGQFGTVWLARERRFQFIVALKSIKKKVWIHPMPSPSSFVQFLVEHKLEKQLQREIEIQGNVRCDFFPVWKNILHSVQEILRNRFLQCPWFSCVLGQKRASLGPLGGHIGGHVGYFF